MRIASGSATGFPTVSITGDESARVTPLTISDVFTYPINESPRPSKLAWRDATVLKAQELSVGEGIEVVFE